MEETGFILATVSLSIIAMLKGRYAIKIKNFGRWKKSGRGSDQKAWKSAGNNISRINTRLRGLKESRKLANIIYMIS